MIVLVPAMLALPRMRNDLKLIQTTASGTEIKLNLLRWRMAATDSVPWSQDLSHRGLTLDRLALDRKRADTLSDANAQDGQENGLFLFPGSLLAGRPVVLRCGLDSAADETGTNSIDRTFRNRTRLVD
jgi:hypothetical protein